ncbi:GNAT family N-acetyltransferase [Consotaella aegiceratis]|uniref:GNAT family N-acetyltransferase n=1 Tax=Consotaella aegiceratis TaxID=3097961 RepID=UPI002F4144B5
MRIRPETASDAAAIRALTDAAFRDAPHSDGTEAAIIDRLREAGAMTLSLVAVDSGPEADGEIVGHVAFSPALVGSGEAGWYGLGPLSVRPDVQHQGIGSLLVEEGLRRLRGAGAKGCVLIGDPAFYRRLGFESDAALTYRGLPTRNVQRFVIEPPAATGEITYHAAFEAAA